MKRGPSKSSTQKVRCSTELALVQILDMLWYLDKGLSSVIMQYSMLGRVNQQSMKIWGVNIHTNHFNIQRTVIRLMCLLQYQKKKKFMFLSSSMNLWWLKLSWHTGGMYNAKIWGWCEESDSLNKIRLWSEEILPNWWNRFAGPMNWFSRSPDLL